jgi:hypothetical protein
MSRAARRPARVRMPYVEQLAQRLSPRDRSIISTIYRLRLISGPQLERLHFHELTGRSRSVKRSQTLKRLADMGVIAPLDRLVGSANRGSAPQCYTLDTAGRRFVQLRVNRESPETHVRRPRVPGDRFIAHTLAVSELYVVLVELSRLGGFTIVDFQAEADAYRPDGGRGWIKPDAFVRMERGETADYWWYEADLATESLPTIRSKLLAYLDFVQRGQLGPDGLVPRVLIGVRGRKRQEAIQAVIDGLPEPAAALFLVADMAAAAQIMADEITREQESMADG